MRDDLFEVTPSCLMKESLRMILRLAIVAILGIGFFLFAPPSVGVILLALLGGAILLVPYYKLDWDPFTPLGFVGLAYLNRIAGPAIDIVVRGPSDVPAMLGHDLSYLVAPLAVVVAGMCCFVLGFISDIGSILGQELPQFQSTWDIGRARRVILLYLIVGIAIYTIFLIRVGIPVTIETLSTKRSFEGTAYVRWGVLFLIFASILTFTNRLLDGRSIRSPRALPMWTIIGFAATYPIYTSNRGLLLTFLLAMAVIYHYFYRRIPLVALGGIAFVFMTIAGILLGLRKISRNPVELADYLSISTIFESVLGANYGGITLLSHIVHRVPKDLPLMYGTSMLDWIFFPLPSMLGFEHPGSIGSMLAAEVYGRPNGTPPTLIGELYLNYWFVGVLIGMMIFGIVARVGYSYLRNGRSNPVTVILYTVFVTQFIFFAMLGHLTTAMIHILMWMLPFVLAVLYISRTSLGEVMAMKRVQEKRPNTISNSKLFVKSLDIGLLAAMNHSRFVTYNKKVLERLRLTKQNSSFYRVFKSSTFVRMLWQSL